MAIEWGSVADWIAGVGGLLSIMATGYIAFSERARAAKLEDQAEALEYARRQILVDELRSVLADLEKLHENYFVGEKRSFGGWRPEYKAYKEKADAMCARISALQPFAASNPSLFNTISSIASANSPEEMDIHSTWTMSMAKAHNRSLQAHAQSGQLAKYA